MQSAGRPAGQRRRRFNCVFIDRRGFTTYELAAQVALIGSHRAQALICVRFGFARPRAPRKKRRVSAAAADSESDGRTKINLANIYRERVGPPRKVEPARNSSSRRGALAALQLNVVGETAPAS